jgi:hypothetical protein
VVTARERSNRGLLASCGALALLVPVAARADLTKVECADEDARGQALRREGKLAAARHAISACADPSCPALVRDDCASQLDALDRVQPTIAFQVKDQGGSDLTSVTVTVDGVPLTTTLEGKPFELDPGRHVFVFSAPPHPTVSRSLVLTEGEKGRLEHIVLDNAGATSTFGVQRTAGLVTMGFGVAGVVFGSAMGLAASSAWSDAAGACGGSTTHCTNIAAGQSERSSAVTDASISTAAFIVAGLCLGGGAALFFTGGFHGHPPSTGLLVAPVFGPGQAGGAVGGVF